MKNNASVEVVKPESPNMLLDRDLMRIASVSLLIGFACLAGAMESLRSKRTGFYFAISPPAFLAAAVGGGFCLLCWKMMMGGRPWQTRMAATLLIGSAILSFLYPLRFVRLEERWQIAEGLAAATCAISIGVALLWRLKRFFDEDGREA